jgi:hypothetical protein
MDRIRCEFTYEANTYKRLIGRDHFGGLDGRIILKHILRKYWVSLKDATTYMVTSFYNNTI